jgi:hypothetical protein
LPMSDVFDDMASELLTLDAYRVDLRERRLALGAGHDSWKLERQQYFSDPTDPPWVAFSQGRWDESIRLMGERIRVVDADRVRELEDDGPLPDILTAGTDTVYRILYTDEGVPEAARRIVDHEVVKHCLELIQELYADGEDMDAYFEREIAHLGPPRLE